MFNGVWAEATYRRLSSVARQLRSCEILVTHEELKKKAKTHRFRSSALVDQVLAEAANNIDLFLGGQAVDGNLNHVTHSGLVHSNEAVVVHECEESHDELAVHAIGDSTVARDRLAEVLDLESTLQTGSKESTEGSNKGGECSEAENVELDRGDEESLVQAEHLERVGLGDEHLVGHALKASQDICSQIINRADEVLVAHQPVSQEITEDNGADPRAEETLNGLLGRQLDQLSTSKCNTTDIGEDIVGNDQRSGEEEPNHALENVVHHKVSLDNNQVQRHVSPSKLGELEPIVSLLQRSDEEHEA